MTRIKKHFFLHTVIILTYGPVQSTWILSLLRHTVIKMLNEQQAQFLLVWVMFTWHDWPCIWCLGKRSLEHTAGEILGSWIGQPCPHPHFCWYIQGGTPGFYNPSSHFQSKRAPHRPSAGWGVGLPSPSHHKHKVTKLHKDNWLSSSTLCSSYSSSHPQCLHFSVSNTLMKPLPDHKLERMLWWGKNIDILWYHTKVQCHGKNLMTGQIITSAGSIYNHFSPFHRWSVAWGDANQLGRLLKVVVFPALDGCWEKQHPWEESCWDSGTVCSQWTAEGFPSHSQGGLSCSSRSSLKETTHMPGLPLGPSCFFRGCDSLTMSTQHLSPKKLLSCFLTYKHVKNSDHQKPRWQHQGEADVDLYVKKGNLCWCGYNKKILVCIM